MERMNFALPSEELREFSALIDLIYAGATEPARWPAVLERLAHWMGASKSMLYTPTRTPDHGGFVFTLNIGENFIEQWRTKYHAEDPWVIAALQRNIFQTGNYVSGDQLVPTADLMASPMYKEVLSKADILHLLTMIIYGSDQALIPPLVCAFYRGIQDPGFDEVSLGKAGLLMPHLSRALGVMLRLQDAEYKVAASQAALDRLSAGVLLLDRHGKVCHTNRAARNILLDEDGLRLSEVPGKAAVTELTASRTTTQNALLAAIEAAVNPDILATEHFNSHLIVERPSGRAPYTLQFSSLAPNNEFGRGSDAPRAIVFLTDTAEPIPVNEQLLREVYRLTAAEIRVAQIMLEGVTAEEAATQLNVSTHTLRTQLHAVYGKLGVDSRARFVKLMLSLAAQ